MNNFKKKQASDFEKGKKAEDRFAELIPGCRKATKEEDREKHIDLFLSRELCAKHLKWHLPKGMKEVSFDVKTIKKVNDIPREDAQYLELQNVEGKLGWIYGEAYCIVFEQTDSWIIALNKTVRELAEKHSKGKVASVENKYKFHEPYMRATRKDITVLVETSEIKYVLIVKKK